MQIHEIIRTKRLEKQMTQEKLAEYLGVSTSAVNKWEKQISYPDITLLPILARVLDTDLNTLLSFKEELTPQEIAMFLNELSEKLYTEDFSTVYKIAMDKIKEYPTSDSLIFQIAVFLDGAITLTNSTEYTSSMIEPLYEQLLYSKDERIQNQVKRMLVHKCIQSNPTNVNYINGNCFKFL